jgi:hypothetical protein
MTFDLDRELGHSQVRLSIHIDSMARSAINRLNWMHAVGSGICYCGNDYEAHGWDETHTPTEMPMDKGYVDD